jgi:hypothetical protein
MFSFSASPLGCLFGGLPRNNTYRKREGRSNYRMRENPVFMRLRRTLPMVTMRLGRVQSQWENTGFPQFSWVFVGETPIFAGF